MSILEGWAQLTGPTDIHKQDLVHTDIKTENVILSLSFSHLVNARWTNSSYEFTSVSNLMHIRWRCLLTESLCSETYKSKS